MCYKNANKIIIKLLSKNFYCCLIFYDLLYNIRNLEMLTQKRRADVLRDLVARLAGLREVAQLLVQHSLKLELQYIH